MKETETFQYLDRTSCHPKSVFKGFIKGEIIRHIRNTHAETQRLKIIDFFKSKLLQRNYDASEIDEAINSTLQLERKDLLVDKIKDNARALVLVSKYNPAVKQLKRAIVKHWNIIQKNLECASIFTVKPMIAYKRHKNLQDILTKCDKT